MRNSFFRFIERRLGAFATKYNQRKVLERAKSNEFIFIEPTPPRKQQGSIEHYYHFIFDLILPLSNLIENTPSDVTFVVKDFGIYTDRLLDLFPGRIKIETEINLHQNTNRIPLIGMNPKWVYLNSRTLEIFKDNICHKLKIIPNGRANKVLLIERLPPDPYFLTKAIKQGGGTTRRSIPNHDELASAIQSLVSTPFEFHNLQLETMSLDEQIKCFDNAVVVIGQHGAGLANCIWMKRQSTVIELSSDAYEHYSILSSLKDHSYFRYQTSGPHSNININEFANWLLNEASLQRFFCHPSHQ